MLIARWMGPVYRQGLALIRETADAAAGERADGPETLQTRRQPRAIDSKILPHGDPCTAAYRAADYETLVSILRPYEIYVSYGRMTSVAQCIHDQYEKLPLGERKIADVLLEIQEEVASYSATELAARAGVSKATATRLVRRLGFDDYLQMRQQAREAKRAGSPLAALPGLIGRRGSLGGHLEHDVACLIETLEGMSSESIRRAIDILTAAERVWVVGFRNSHVLAFYGRELLVQVKPDVRLLPTPGQTIAEELSALTDGDAVLMLGFRRRPPIIAKILRAAVEADAPVVLLADHSLGSIDKLAAVTLRCISRGSSLFDSYVAPVSLLNFICAGVATAMGEVAQMRFRRTAQLHEELSEL